MTIDEFVVELPKCGPWILKNYTLRNEDGQCPLVSVCRLKTGRVHSNDDYYSAGTDINMSHGDIYDIMSAADGDLFQKDLQVKMLHSIGTYNEI